MKIPHSIMAICCAVLLSACGSGGGGGDGAAEAPAAQSFPLRAAFSALYAGGLANKDFTVSGASTGTASVKQAPANVETTFENVAGFSAIHTQTLNLPTVSTTIFTTIYYDKAYAPLGYQGAQGAYSVFETPQRVATSAPMPEFGKVGDVGNLGTLTNYNTSAKTTKSGRTTRDYVIAADGTATATAIVTVIARNFDAADVLINTESDRYRIGMSGAAATLLSIDIQDGPNPNLHVKFE